MPLAVIYANKPKDFSLWDAHKDVLKDLYLTQKRSLKEVKRLMESEHGFPNDLTVSAYETTLRDHFGFRKNLKRSNWEAIGTHLEKREGKESDVAFLGDRLTSKRIAKETGRYCPRARKGGINAGNPIQGPTPALPAGITISTPPPTQPETVPDPFGRTVPRSEHDQVSSSLWDTAVYGPPSSTSKITPPPSVQSEVERLLNGQFKEVWKNLPFIEFTRRLLEILKSQSHLVSGEVLQSLLSLHQMTGSPMVFGLSSSMILEDSVIGGDAASTKAMIRKGLPIPRIVKPEYIMGSPKDLNRRLECVKILVEAGVSIDAKADDHLHWNGPAKPDLLTDWLWLHRHQKALEVCSRYSERLQTCVTVSGICAAAGEGLERLSRYVQEKRTPSYQVTQELLQVALSEASEQGLEGIVETLLEYGVDIEVSLLKAREWNDERHPRPIPLCPFEWLPAFRAVLTRNARMITLLARHGAVFNCQEIMDATMDNKWRHCRLISPPPDIKPVVELLAHIGVNIKQHGTETMLKAVGLLNHRDCSWRVDRSYRPNRDIIKALKELGVAWDQDYFSNRDQLSSWEGWDGRESGGMDLVQAAVLKGCHEDTVDCLLSEGMQVHSEPCKADGKSIVYAAVENGNLRILEMILERITDVQSDPAWPKLLELSFHGYSGIYSGQIYGCLKDQGATFAPLTSHCEAKRRLGLIPKMLRAGVSQEAIQSVWGDVVGVALLKEEDFASVLDDTIHEEGFIWAYNMIEQGICLKDKGILWLACQVPACPLWFIRYLLRRDINIEGSYQGNGRTALHYAAENGNLALSTLLMAYGANVNGIWNYNDLHCAEHGIYGCRTYHATRRSYTPLDLASATGRLDVVKLLLDCGGRSALPGVTGFDGALDLARKWCRGGVVLLLESWVIR
ncbi:hypothetical protein PG996_009095 [Apiospora saccharicola]|uniref:Clr5 domain-containing protein n=1 Tax=Apiospora saccharicola TaxID=335842 RepID=A0ABR1UM65_9PEZI